MADFTTWSALKTAFLNEWSNNPQAARVMEYTAPSGQKVSMRSFQDFRRFLEYIDVQIDAETEGMAQNLVEFGR